MAANAQPEFLGTPVSWRDVMNSQFIKAADLKGFKVTFTIAAVHEERVLADDRGGKKVAATISFKQVKGKPITEKRWMLNDINKQCLSAMFGDDIGACIGKRVTLMSVPFSSAMLPDVTEALRVWGSPDLASDMDIKIKQPFKKAKPMTMHKVTREPAQGSAPATNTTTGQRATEASSGAAPEAAGSGNGPGGRPQSESSPGGEPPVHPSGQAATVTDWVATLRACKSITAIDKTWADCKAAVKEIPDEIDAAYQETRSALMEGDGEL